MRRLPTSLPIVDVAVVLAFREGRCLTVFDHKWGAFTYPMAKTRRLPTADGRREIREPAEQAATRAAAEVLGRPLSPEGLPRPIDFAVEPFDVAEPYHRSSRERVWKRYDFHLFSLRVDEPPKPVDGATLAWLSPEQLATYLPTAPWVPYLLDRLRGLEGAFP